MGHGCHECGVPNGCECPRFHFDIEDMVVVKNTSFTMNAISAREFRGRNSDIPWYKVNEQWCPQTALVRAIEVKQDCPNFRANLLTPIHHEILQLLKPLYDVVDGNTKSMPTLPHPLRKVFGFSNLLRFDSRPWTQEYTERVLSHLDAYAWRCVTERGVAMPISKSEPVCAPTLSKPQQPTFWNQLEID